jgi:hypothetical protein
MTTLEYWYAFDLCAMSAQGKSAQVVTSHEHHRNELNRRITKLATPPFQVAIWAEPTRDTAPHLCRELYENLLPGGELLVVVSGALGRFLPVHESRSLGDARTLKLLQQQGFLIAHTESYHSILSIMWSYAFRLAQRLGREDWGARCLVQMRRVYVTDSAGTIKLIYARKP